MADLKKNQNAEPTAEELLSQSEAFLLKYKNVIICAVVVLVVAIAGFVLYNNYVVEPNEQKASTALAKGQDLFQNQQFDLALNGDSVNFQGFLSVAKEYSSTKAGNLANLYIGLCYAHLNKWQEAAEYLDKFSGASDEMISPAAEGALGNALAHLERYDEAVKHLKAAAEKADNDAVSPTFLIQAGEILESQGKKEEALKLYQTVKEKYFAAPVTQQVIEQYIERVK